MVYPLIMQPYYRYGEATPWGGNRLNTLYNKNTTDPRTGESLEISALLGHESTVLNGEYAGRTLSQMITLWGEALTGKVEQPFPLLLKFLDAKEMLSVQVHPSDVYAKQQENKLGKTEAWVVLEAEKGAKLVYGVDTHANLGELLKTQDIESALTWIEVAPGDVLYIRHGTVHALGGGIVIYEIQQSSDVTYRLWDWGRVGADGKPRELHTKKALDVIRTDIAMGKLQGETANVIGGEIITYIEDEYLGLKKLVVDGTMELISIGKFQMLTVFSSMELRYGDENLSLVAGQSVLLPASLNGCKLCGSGWALLSTPPKS